MAIDGIGGTWTRSEQVTIALRSMHRHDSGQGPPLPVTGSTTLIALITTETNAMKKTCFEVAMSIGDSWRRRVEIGTHHRVIMLLGQLQGN